jgi:hypothetical protein
LPRPTRPDGPLPDRDEQADDAGDHQDQADRPQIQALDVEMGGESKDRANRNQKDASRKGHLSPLKDAAEEIDGEQDQDDHDQDSDDGQDDSLVDF